MWPIIAGIIQIILILLKNKSEQDDEIKKKKEALHAEAKEVIASRDAGRINDFLLKLRT